MSVGTIWDFFWKKTTIRKIFQTWVEVSDFRLTRYTTVLDQLSTPSEEPLRERFLKATFFLQKFCVQILSCFFELCQNFFKAVVKTPSYVSRRNFRLVCVANLPFFSNFEQKFIEVLTGKISQLFSKRHSACSEEHLEKKNLNSFLFFSYFESLFLEFFGRKTPARLSKLKTTFPGETFRHFFLAKLLILHTFLT